MEPPFAPAEDDYLTYTFHRFQACRFGLDGTFVDPETGKHHTLREDIYTTLAALAPHAAALHAEDALALIRGEPLGLGNDATWIRGVAEREHLLPEVVRQQRRRWAGQSKYS